MAARMFGARMRNILRYTVLSCLVVAFAAAGRVAAQPLQTRVGNALPTANVAYLEFMGSGLNISLNYERTILESNTLRVGLGAYGFNTGVGPDFQWVPVVPIVATHYFLQGSTRLGVGLGAIIHLTSYGWETMFPALSDATVKGTAEFGVRYMPTSSSFVAGARITPVFDATGIAPWMGLYLGWGF